METCIETIKPLCTIMACVLTPNSETVGISTGGSRYQLVFPLTSGTGSDGGGALSNLPRVLISYCVRPFLSTLRYICLAAQGAGGGVETDQLHDIWRWVFVVSRAIEESLSLVFCN